jgi:microcystin degradation protein MlrC
MWGGARLRLGPMAQLRLGGVRIVVASKKVQAADQSIFRHVAIEPKAQRILALKSSVHFRADFAPISEEILVVAAPGAMAADPAALPFRRLRPGIRLRPLGPAFAATGP